MLTGDRLHTFTVFGLFWYWWYYPHTLRDLVSPVCGVFLWWEKVDWTCFLMGGSSSLQSDFIRMRLKEEQGSSPVPGLSCGTLS